MKLFFFLVVLALLPAGLTGQRQPSRWVNICTQDPDATSYCRDVGKSAYNSFGAQALRLVQLGKIVGVAWRPRGSIIGMSSDGQVRTSTRSAYYYIIDDGGEQRFLRQAREISVQRRRRNGAT